MEKYFLFLPVFSLIFGVLNICACLGNGDDDNFAKALLAGNTQVMPSYLYNRTLEQNNFRIITRIPLPEIPLTNSEYCLPLPPQPQWQGSYYEAPALVYAVAGGSPEIVKALLTANPNGINRYVVFHGRESWETIYHDYWTPFYEAIRLNKTELIPILLAANASIDKIYPYNRNLLQLAVRHSNLQAVELLIDQKIPLTPNRYGINAFHEAGGVMDDDRIIKRLLQTYSTDNWYDRPDIMGRTPLWVAAWHNNTQAASLLLAQGAFIDHSSKSGLTPLLLAAKMGNLKMVKFLIEHHANITIKDIYNKSALELAATQGHIHVIEYFLEEKTFTNIGKAFSLAVANQKTDAVLKFLSHHNTYSSLTKNDLANALLYTVKHQHLDCFKHLLDAGAPIWAIDENGNNPIHFAINNIAFLEAIAKKHNPSALAQIKNDREFTPLHYAASKGYTLAIINLAKAGVNLNITGPQKQTPLYLAIDSGQVETVNTLLQLGADPQIPAYFKQYGWVYPVQLAKFRQLRSVTAMIADTAEITPLRSETINTICQKFSRLPLSSTPPVDHEEQADKPLEVITSPHLPKKL